MTTLALLLVTLLPQADGGPLKDRLDADDVRRVGDRLRSLQGPIDPALLKSLEKFLRDNPGLKPEELAQKFLARRPDLLRPENLAKLPKLLEHLDGRPAPAGDGLRTEPQAGTQPGPAGTSPTPSPDVTPVPGGNLERPTTPGRMPTTPADPPAATDPPPSPRAEGPLPNLPPSPPANTAPTAAPAIPAPPPNTPVPSEETTNFQAAAGWWEKNVGPLEDTPAVRDLLLEVIKGAGTADGRSPLSSLLKDIKGDGPSGFKEWAAANLPKDWKLPNLGLGGPKATAPSFPAAPALPAAPVAPGFTVGGSPAPVYVLAAIGIVATAVFLLRPAWNARLAAGRPTPVPGLGPWPIDPRRVNRPEDLVLAFDYLSVLTLGPGARQYSHRTIAGELRRLVPHAAAAAEALGGFYEAARYAPPGDPADLAAARAALCRVAGVPA